MMDVHDFLPPDPTLMQKYKEYQETPHFLWSDFTGGRIRKALILDCEMVGVQTPEGQKNELVLLCVADYFTGETLVNNLVRPSSRNVDWRTRYSGVTAADMDDAIKKGTALNGWMAARAKLWEMIDSETILIGHSLKNDLDILRIIHTKIIDSVILTSNAIGVSKSLHSPLQGLCKQLLGMTIQDHGLQGHICLEDVLATREVVIWCVENPSALAEWAQVVAEQERHKKEEMEKARKEKSEKQVLEKVEKRKRAESDALVKNASSKRVTGQVKGPTQGPGGVGGQASDTADAKTEDRLEQEGSREPKRLKPTTKTSDTDDSENLGLLSGRVFKNLTLRQATTDTPLPKPDSVPHLLD
jgi:DNA polymerase III epsilon subunit-like protein